jgi:hypothetical protein
MCRSLIKASEEINWGLNSRTTFGAYTTSGYLMAFTTVFNFILTYSGMVIGNVKVQSVELIIFTVIKVS